MKIDEAVRNRLPSVLIAIASVAAVAGIEISEVEINAVVEGVLQGIAAVSGLYAIVRVWVDKVRARFGA